MTYDKKYSTDSYYWGKEPSQSAVRLIEQIKLRKLKFKTLLDLGCGEGRNSIFFAKNNIEVTGLDISQTGLDKVKKLSKENSIHIETVCSDILDLFLTKNYDIIFSSGTLHYLPENIRKERFDHFQKQTNLNGIHAMNVFVSKPFLNTAPDAEKKAHLYKSGELLSYYADWEILFSDETIFDCNSSGIPHKHAINNVIARKVVA